MNLPNYQLLDEEDTGWKPPDWAIITLMVVLTGILLLSSIAFFFLFVKIILYEMGLAPILEFIL